MENPYLYCNKEYAIYLSNERKKAFNIIDKFLTGVEKLSSNVKKIEILDFLLCQNHVYVECCRLALKNFTPVYKTNQINEKYQGLTKGIKLAQKYRIHNFGKPLKLEEIWEVSQ